MQNTFKTLAALAAGAGLAVARPLTGNNVVAKRDFNAAGSNNVAAWWGNSPKTNAADLDKICGTPEYDIVILTFATQISSANVVVAGGAESKTLSSSIKKCQSAGKKVFMSIGGATGTITFGSAQEAQTAADNVAKAFLTDGSYYGTKLDGIDLDIETGNSAHWDDFVKALRPKASNNQYISGAPQCPEPDASLPPDTLNLMDFVWVQFYNNGPCNQGATGFADAVKKWSSVLTKPKLYIAAPGDSASANTGYIQPDAMTAEIKQVQGFGLKNFGGVALWDASTALLNNNYQKVVKSALGGGSSGSTGGSNSEPASAAPTAAPTQATSAPQGKGQQTGDATVQATSTAVVTSTAFAPSGAAPTGAAPTGASPTGAAPTGAAPTAPGTSSPSGQPCSDAGKVVCSSDGKQFGICDGKNAVMSNVAQGTTCSNGQITAIGAGASGSDSAPAPASS